MSFIDYYKRQYQIDIQDRKQPLLVNRPTLKKRGVAEAEADRVVCLIPGMLRFDEKNSANSANIKFFLGAEINLGRAQTALSNQHSGS